MKTILTGVAETLLIPLWARAEEWNKKEPIIMDEHAVNLLNEIDYDFSKFEGSWMSQTGCAIRARILDVQTKRFIQKNPESIIINIGCGLDTRFFRVDNGMIGWYEIDLPQAIKLRKQFFTESERYRMIAKSVFDYSWIKDIKEKKKPVLIISEGTFMYFDEKEVKEIFDKITQHFPKAEMLLETVPPFIVKNSKKHETLKKMNNTPVFRWGISNLKDLEKINDNVKFLDAITLFDFHKKRWRWLGKLAMIPWVYNNMNDKIVRLKFK